MNILRDVTDRLSQAGLQYMLTGSFALNYYAQPRMTRDIDLVVALKRSDANTLVASFENDYYVDRDAVLRAIANESLFNVIHNEHIVKVDFIIRKNTDYRRIEFDRRREITIEDMNIWIVSREDLIISKLFWANDSHSEFQLRDVKNLLRSDYDAEYLQVWTERLGLNDLLRECLDE